MTTPGESELEADDRTTVDPEEAYDADLDDPEDDITGFEEGAGGEGDDATDIEPELDDDDA